jgi:hypothetical protein
MYVYFVFYAVAIIYYFISLKSAFLVLNASVIHNMVEAEENEMQNKSSFSIMDMGSNGGSGNDGDIKGRRIIIKNELREIK